MGVDAGAYGGAAEGDLRKLFPGVGEASDAELDLVGVSKKLLAEAYRCRVLEVGPAGLDDVPEVSGLGFEGGLGALEGGDEIGLDFSESREVHCSGDNVVRGLALVYVVVGMDDSGADVAAHKFRGSVGDNLVGVHVGGGAGAGLEDIEYEVDRLVFRRRLPGRPGLLRLSCRSSGGPGRS